MNKYNALAADIDGVVKPVVFESTGRLHPETITLFKQIAGVDSNKVCTDEKNLYRYWMRVVSVTLQKGLARAFLVGRRRLMSNNYRVPHQYSTCSVNAYNDLYVMSNSSNDE